MLAVRWVVFAVGPWLLVIAGAFVWWASYHLLAPLFMPLTAYSFSGGQWTIFAERNFGWPINVGYSAALASAASWLGRQFTFGRSIALFIGLALAVSLSVHGLMAALGYHYWYDGP